MTATAISAWNTPAFQIPTAPTLSLYTFPYSARWAGLAMIDGRERRALRGGRIHGLDAADVDARQRQRQQQHPQRKHDPVASQIQAKQAERAGEDRLAARRFRARVPWSGDGGAHAVTSASLACPLRPVHLVVAQEQFLEGGRLADQAAHTGVAENPDQLAETVGVDLGMQDIALAC